MNYDRSTRRHWLVGLLLAGMLTGVAQPVRSAEPAGVRLVVNYGDGVEKHFLSLKWKSGMTVLDALRQASEHPRGIRFKHQGRGTTALLTEIDGLKNEGNGRNWLYRVNDQLGDRSFAIRELATGDAILWKFEEYK